MSDSSANTEILTSSMIKKLSRISIRTMPTHLNHIHILYGYIIQRNSLYTRNTIQRKTEKAKPVTSNKDYDTIEKIIKNRQIQIQTQKKTSIDMHI